MYIQRTASSTSFSFTLVSITVIETWNRWPPYYNSSVWVAFGNLKMVTAPLPCVARCLLFGGSEEVWKRKWAKTCSVTGSFCQSKHQAIFNPPSMTVKLSSSLGLPPLLLFVGTLDNHQVILTSFYNTLSSFSFHFTHVKPRVGGLLSAPLSHAARGQRGQQTVCQDSGLTNQTSARKQPGRYKERFVWEERRADSTKNAEFVRGNKEAVRNKLSCRLRGNYQQFDNSHMEKMN